MCPRLAVFPGHSPLRFTVRASLRGVTVTKNERILYRGLAQLLVLKSARFRAQDGIRRRQKEVCDCRDVVLADFDRHNRLIHRRFYPLWKERNEFEAGGRPARGKEEIGVALTKEKHG